MKKYLKIIALIACAAILCMTLCSCEALNDAKSHTAYFTDNTKDTLAFHDHTYKRIGTPNNVGFIMENTVSDYHAATTDIPVLLAASYGRLMLFEEQSDRSIPEDKYVPTVLSVLVNNTDEDAMDGIFNAASLFMAYYDYKNYSDTMEYYVVAEEYDRIKALIDKAECDCYYTSYYKYDDPDRDWYGGGYVNAVLEDDTTAAIKRALKEGETVQWTDLARSDWYGIHLYSSDKDIVITDDHGCLVITDGFDYYVVKEGTYNTGTDKLYKVADSDFEAMRKLYKLCENSLELEDIDWWIDQASE